MFRLLSLNFSNEILGHFPSGSLVFVPEAERKNKELPYSTVLIGQNGTGKSTLLYYISEIFQDLMIYKEHSKRKSKINFSYILEYQIDNIKYSVKQSTAYQLDLSGKGIPINWKYELKLFDLELQQEIKYDNENDKWINLKLPTNVIVLTHLPIDRFNKKENFANDFYIYLGLVDRTNAARPSRLLNNSIALLFDKMADLKSIDFLKDILKFMEVDQNYLKLSSDYRYKKHFFDGNLSVEKFINLFQDWATFSNRAMKPFSVEYFETNLKNNYTLIEEIVEYINYRVIADKISIGISSHIEIDVFQKTEMWKEWEFIRYLKKLDLLESFTLEFRKSKNNNVDNNQLSSGEFHYFSTMISLFSSIRENSLVLIDEPETSFHPNWQMKYINHLKNIFKEFHTAHFILSTHSHFIISDLEGESSEVIGLTGHVPNVKAESLNLNTYGWSAEEVLYKVFNIKTSRNYFLEYDLTRLVSLLNSNSNDSKEFERILSKLNIISFSQEDPINIIIEKAQKYFNKIK